MLTLPNFQVIEKPGRSGFLSVPCDTEVLSYPDVVVNLHTVEKAEPFTANKLPVSHQMSDGTTAGKTEEAINQFYSLLGIGVAAFVHHLEHYGECHPFVDDSKSQDVYVSCAELPVRTIHSKCIGSGHGYQL